MYVFLKTCLLAIIDDYVFQVQIVMKETKTFGKVATIGWKHIAMNFYENCNGSFFGLIKSCHVQLKCIWEI